jgi:hypothetical protein
MIFFVVMIDLYFIFTRGAKKQLAAEDDWSDEKALWISAVVGAGCAVISFFVGIPFLRNKLKQKHEADSLKLANSAEKGTAADMVQLPMPTSAIDLATTNNGLHVEVNSHSPLFSPVSNIMMATEVLIVGRLQILFLHQQLQGIRPSPRYKHLSIEFASSLADSYEQCQRTDPCCSAWKRLRRG